MSDNMKDLFFIVKGQYRKGVEPCFVNGVTKDTNYIGGYDPYSDDTEEWYMLMDCKTFYCVSCGSDLKKVLKGVYNVVMKYKGVAKSYFKHISDITSDDYYETHYLGRTPLDHEQRTSKAEGRCPRVSPAMRELYRHIYEEYGDHFSDEIEDMVNLAYHDLKERKPISKARKLSSKIKPKGEVTTPKTPTKAEDEKTPKAKATLKSVKPKVKLKKL